MRVVLTLALVGCGFSARVDGEVNPQGDASGVGGVDAPKHSVDSGGPTSNCASPNQRVCIDSTHSGHCDAGLQQVKDRDCPPNSTCMNGFCEPPTAATPCTAGTMCTGNQLCDLYVVSGVLAGFCTDPFGSTTGSCQTAGNDPSCNTGICASKSDGSERRCLRPCLSGSGCVGGSQVCISVGNPLTLEGTSTSGQQYCVPD